MDFSKLNNEQIYTMVRNRILSSTYWQGKLFRTISGYKESELRETARHTRRINGCLEARLEDLRVCSFALPYLAKGRPIRTGTPKERKVLISFFDLVEAENRKSQKDNERKVLKESVRAMEERERMAAPQEPPKEKPEPDESEPMPVRSRRRKAAKGKKKKDKKPVSLTVEEMERIVREWEAYVKDIRTPFYLEKKEKAFKAVSEARDLDDSRKVSVMLGAAEEVKGTDKLKILKKVRPLLQGKEKEDVNTQISDLEKRMSLESLASFRLKHNIVI